MTAAGKENVLCLMREPFSDKMPAVRALLGFLAEKGHRVFLLSPADPDYRKPSFLAGGMTYVEVKGRWSRRIPVRVPLTAALVLEARRLREREEGSWLILGAGAYGTVAARLLSLAGGGPYAAYLHEYPAPAGGAGGGMSWGEKLVRRSIAGSALTVVFDEWHARFLEEECGVDRGKMMLLPNADRGRGAVTRTAVLREKFGIPADHLILLHSGGMGGCFQSRELAGESSRWPPQWHLVFHTSYRVAELPYTEEVKSAAGERVHFSTEPLPASELRGMVASADIGLALYSRELLGLRADLIGLAAGKIGDYLRCGLPVVATDLPSVAPFIKKYRCGVCVRGPEEVADAVRTILDDYDRYREGAVRCFNELWDPESCLEKIGERFAAWPGGQRGGR